MPGTEGYPFRRLAADHLIRGVTRVWWELDRNFHDSLPYTFQLQTGSTGNSNAVDWVDVGGPVVNGYYAEDDERRPGDYGKSLTTHYRVRLTTPARVYVSQPVSTYGELDPRGWLLAREVVRKERLRHRLVSVDGWLLRRLRFGAKCVRCLDTLTGETLDITCPECHGTGFQVGYHPPVPMTVDLAPDAIVERRGSEPPGPTRTTGLRMRVLGFPDVAKYDVWVDGKSDQRWEIDTVQHLAEWRHVPLISELQVKLLAFTHAVYALEVGGEAADAAPQTLPKSGPGDFCIDHDYTGADQLAYRDACGNGIVGATILAIPRADYDANRRSSQYAVAISHTLANGRWAQTMCLCCGEDYVLVFEKAGSYGPNAVSITIPCSVGSSESSDAGPQAQAQAQPQGWMRFRTGDDWI